MSTKTDPTMWDLDLNAGKAAAATLKGGTRTFGIPCPNKNFGQKCYGCERAYNLFQTGREDDNKTARRLYVKKAPVCNVEFLDERGKTYLMVLPGGVATSILDGIYETRAWGNIAHPNPKKEDTTSGYPLILSKSKEGEYNKYNITPKMGATHEERKISGKGVLDQCYKFSTLMRDIADGKEKDINFFYPRSDMAVGMKREFKILPNVEDYKASPIFIGYVHFILTADEIYGKSNTQSSPIEEFEKIDELRPNESKEEDLTLDLEDELFK